MNRVEAIIAGRTIPLKVSEEEEVYVIRYERGIAYVKRWEDLPEANPQGSEIRGQGSKTTASV